MRPTMAGCRIGNMIFSRQNECLKRKNGRISPKKKIKFIPNLVKVPCGQHVKFYQTKEMKKSTFLLCGALTLASGFSRTSCGDDGDDELLTGTGTTTTVSTNPFKGKTLKCVKTETPSSSVKISTHFRITFQTDIQCTWSMYQLAQEYDSSSRT